MATDLDDLRLTSVRRRLVVLGVSLALIVCYLVLGGVVIQVLEASHEQDVLHAIESTLTNITEDERFVVDQTALDEVKMRLHTLGVCKFPDPSQPNWTFAGSVFYAMTVITTIGYGSLAPQTFNGKAFTIVYSILGIALMGNMLTNCAHLLAGISKGLIQRVSSKLRQTRMIQRDVTNEEQQDSWDATFAALESKFDENGMLPATYLREVLELASNSVVADGIVVCILEKIDPDESGLVTRGGVARAISLWHETHMQLPEGAPFAHLMLYLISTTAWVVFWGFAFAAVEGWSFRDATWFGFVTLTTIGFGDFSPHTTLGRGLAFLFVIPGLGLAAAVLSTIWKMFDYHRYWFLQKLYRRGKVSEKMLEVHGIQRMNSERKLSKRSTQAKYLQKVRIPGVGSPLFSAAASPMFTNSDDESDIEKRYGAPGFEDDAKLGRGHPLLGRCSIGTGTTPTPKLTPLNRCSRGSLGVPNSMSASATLCNLLGDGVSPLGTPRQPGLPSPGAVGGAGLYQAPPLVPPLQLGKVAVALRPDSRECESVSILTCLTPRDLSITATGPEAYL